MAQGLLAQACSGAPRLMSGCHPPAGARLAPFAPPRRLSPEDCQNHYKFEVIGNEVVCLDCSACQRWKRAHQHDLEMMPPIDASLCHCVHLDILGYPLLFGRPCWIRATNPIVCDEWSPLGSSYIVQACRGKGSPCWKWITHLGVSLIWLNWSLLLVIMTL